MHTKTVQFLFKIPVLQRLFFPVRMWESFPLNFKLIQTTWVWNLAPEIFQPKGLGATWQDAALQKVMALTDAPWSSCLHKPIPPQTILLTEHETHISLPCTSAKPERMWRQWERFWSSRELLLLFPLFTPFHIRPMCLTLGTWSQVGADCLQVGSICNATSSVTFWMPRPALEPKIISWIYFLSIKAWWGSAHWRNRNTSLQQRDCADSSSSRLCRLVEEQYLGVRANFSSTSAPTHRAHLLRPVERCHVLL